MVSRYMRQLYAKHPDAFVISGGAIGVDRAAESCAKQHKNPWLSYRPKGPVMYDRGNGAEELYAVQVVGDPDPGVDLWDHGCYASYGAAAFARNTFIAQSADVVVAFQAGTRGTANTISEACRLGRRVFIHGPDGAPVQPYAAVCRSCKAAVVFHPTPNGKLAPVDSTVGEGNMVIRSGVAIVVREPEPGEERRQSHFATCPQASRHRRRARARG